MSKDAQVIADSREVLSRKARSFRWGAQFLAPERHDDAALLYAFCREVDDAADEAPDAQTAHLALAALEAELHGQAPPRPMMAAFGQMADRVGLERAWAQELITGVRQDLEPVLIPDDVALLRYCYRVAGVVGLMMCAVLQVQDERAYPHAIDLGVAMQLTNICRDVAEDARMGRVYLPQVRLLHHGQPPQGLLRGQASRVAVSRVVLDLLTLADVYYRSAEHGMRYLSPRSRAAILVAARLYRQIGVRLRERGQGDALAGRTIVPWSDKSVRVVGALGRLAKPQVLGIGPSPAHDATLHAALVGLPGVHAPRP